MTSAEPTDLLCDQTSKKWAQAKAEMSGEISDYISLQMFRSKSSAEGCNL